MFRLDVTALKASQADEKSSSSSSSSAVLSARPLTLTVDIQDPNKVLPALGLSAPGTLALDLRRDFTIEFIKVAIEKKTSIPYSQLVIQFGNLTLADPLSIADYEKDGLGNKSKLVAVVEPGDEDDARAAADAKEKKRGKVSRATESDEEEGNSELDDQDLS